MRRQELVWQCPQCDEPDSSPKYTQVSNRYSVFERYLKCLYSLQKCEIKIWFQAGLSVPEVSESFGCIRQALYKMKHKYKTHRSMKDKPRKRHP